MNDQDLHNEAGPQKGPASLFCVVYFEGYQKFDEAERNHHGTTLPDTTNHQVGTDSQHLPHICYRYGVGQKAYSVGSAVVREAPEQSMFEGLRCPITYHAGQPSRVTL